MSFLVRWTIGNMFLFEILMIAASVLGAAPIAIMAFQSLRIKVVSIDVLVTIAVTGAFVIKNYESCDSNIFIPVWCISGTENSQQNTFSNKGTC